MKFKPQNYKMVEETNVLVLSSKSDKLGNLYYCVEYSLIGLGKHYSMFQNLSSALDFINSNFK